MDLIIDIRYASGGIFFSSAEVREHVAKCPSVRMT